MELEPLRQDKWFSVWKSTDALVSAAVVIRSSSSSSTDRASIHAGHDDVPHTETTSKVTETIVSENYSTGFEYSASGVNITPDGPINPVSNTTVNGWTSLGERPNWSIVKPGEAFQFVESLKGPGLSNVTTIQRVPKSQALPIRFPPSRNNRHRSSQRTRRWRHFCNRISNCHIIWVGVQSGCADLQGSAITNTYGGNIQCQGPTLTVTPYLNRTKSWGLPYEYSYDDPVYDLSDLDDNGVLDNPGDVLFYKDTRTGQKDNHNWNVGLSIQATIPLDQGLQRRCKEAVDTQLALQQQLLANRSARF